MDSEQMLEWRMVRERAVAHIRQCDHIDTSRHRPQAHFLILPSLADAIACDIVHNANGFAAYVTAWRQSVDIEAFATPVERLKHRSPFVPTYKSTQVNISFEELSSILVQLRTTRINLAPANNSVCVDGTSFELNSGMGGGFSGIRLRWHN